MTAATDKSTAIGLGTSSPDTTIVTFPGSVSTIAATAAVSKTAADHQHPDDLHHDDIIVYDDAEVAESASQNSWDALKNKNVCRVLIFCFLDGASYSIWRQDAFQVLVDQLGGDRAVGWMSAASGITQMLAAVAAGYAEDRVKRETVLRCGSIAGFLAVLLTMTAASQLSVNLFYLSQCVCGIYSGVAATTTEAIFADSVATGKRGFVYNLKWMDQTMCACVGLIISICVLFSLGNKWEQPALVKTMFVGLVLQPAATAMLWTLRDKYALKEDDERHAIAEAAATEVNLVRDDALPPQLQSPQSPQPPPSSVASGDHPSCASEDTPWSSGQGRPSSALHRGCRTGDGDADDGRTRQVHWSAAPPTVFPPASSASAGAADGVSSAASSSGRPPRSTRHKAIQYQLEEECKAAKLDFYVRLAAARGSYLRQLTCVVSFYAHFIFTWEAVPYIVCLVDFLVAFGSGMTLRYLSLFFVNDYNTTPLTLLTASLLIAPLQALISFLVQRGGDFYIGRLPSTIVVRFIGTTLLLLMGTTTLPLKALLPIYIFRNALMNSTAGVTRSVIMDCVKKENRAKWSAFESFSSFTWAGSAVIGGYIAAAMDYKSTFTITAFFHYCSFAILVPSAIGAMPVEKELMRMNRSKQHTSCKVVTVGVCATLAIASCFYVWFRSEITKRGW